MAKGNDGNLLQHCIEAELATALSDGGLLHLVTTHAMAPFEKLDGTTSAHKLFDFWLRRSGLHYPLDDLPRVLAAYRATNAGPSRYPNSSELLRACVGAPKLSGVICEVVEGKAQQLTKRLCEAEWVNTTLRVHRGSWRSAPKLGLSEVSSSWFVSLDPMQYKPGSATDDEFIYRDDLELIRDAVKPLLDGPLAGAVAVFSYTMTPDVRSAFEGAMHDVFDAESVTVISTTARGGNKHSVAIVSNRPSAVEGAKRAWAMLVERAEL